MTKDQLQLLSVAVLRDMAKKSGVKSVSALRKSALVDALLENQKNQSENSSGHGSEPAGASLKDRGTREDHGRQNPDREENRAHASDAGRKTAKTGGTGSGCSEELQDGTGYGARQMPGASREAARTDETAPGHSSRTASTRREGGSPGEP